MGKRPENFDFESSHGHLYNVIFRKALYLHREKNGRAFTFELSPEKNNRPIGRHIWPTFIRRYNQNSGGEIILNTIHASPERDSESLDIRARIEYILTINLIC